MGKSKLVCHIIDSCAKIAMLFDHDWAGDWQLADAINATCGRCDSSKKKMIERSKLGGMLINRELQVGEVVCLSLSRHFDFREKAKIELIQPDYIVARDIETNDPFLINKEDFDYVKQVAKIVCGGK